MMPRNSKCHRELHTIIITLRKVWSVKEMGFWVDYMTKDHEWNFGTDDPHGEIVNSINFIRNCFFGMRKHHIGDPYEIEDMCEVLLADLLDVPLFLGGSYAAKPVALWRLERGR